MKMTLKQWSDNAWLRSHKTSFQEIEDLLHIVDRDLKDAGMPISADWRFGIAYNASLKLCAILLYAEGYKAERTLQHYRTIQALPLILGDKYKMDAEYLDSCRSKRNIAEYNRAGTVSGTEADELVGFVKNFKEEVVRWLMGKHPQLINR
jgi:hypothetical protein